LNPRPNVILIAMDTVRADHLSCYGYHRKTSPNIDKIAEEGVLFENAFTTGTWSPSSHASIFTGKYPSYHRTLGRNVYLRRGNKTIAEILAANGYRTIGISNCILLHVGTGFERGFQKFVEPFGYFVLPPEFHRRSGTLSMLLELALRSPKDFVKNLVYGPDQLNAYTNRVIKSLIKGDRARKKPFFMFINYFNCHAPYDPPRPFKGRFCSGFEEPQLFFVEYMLEKMLGKSCERIVGRDLNTQKLEYIANSATVHFSFIAGELQISEKEWEVVRSWYDGEIAYLDSCLGELLNFIQDEGIFDNTVIIITADHGENFGEHGLARHRFGLYDSLLHVPLIISHPSLASGRIRHKGTVSTIDILPTILSLCGLGASDDIQGKTLFPFEERKIHNFVCAECGELETDWAWALAKHGARVGASESVNAKLRSSDLALKLRSIDMGSKCIRNEEFKYIFSPIGRDELYDIASDPTEKNNIIHERPDEAKYLRSQLERMLDITYFGPKKTAYSEKEKAETENRLMALGYM